MSYRVKGSRCYGNIRRARKFHAKRTDMAKQIDEKLKAPFARSTTQWLNQPNRYDIPTIDTPKKRRIK